MPGLQHSLSWLEAETLQAGVKDKSSAAAISGHRDCVLSQGFGSWTLVEMGAILAMKLLEKFIFLLFFFFSLFLSGIFPICNKIIFFILAQSE